jgi:putative nucleotidyltransferase with HDIG domain
MIEAEQFVSYYCTPLISKGRVTGVLEVYSRTPLSAGPDWLAFFETLAGQAAIAVDNAQLFENLQKSNLDLHLAYDSTLEGWARALDLRDGVTQGHSRRVTEMAGRLAAEVGIPDAELINVRRGALLHDIGKMGIPDSILHKRGPLTEEEWKTMKKHPVYAWDLLHPIEFLRPALAIPCAHHEHWDGSGYPRGLRGRDIPLAARVFAIVDVWDALRSDRPYSKSWPEEEARAQIRELAGSHLDPELVEVFLGMDWTTFHNGAEPERPYPSPPPVNGVMNEEDRPGPAPSDDVRRDEHEGRAAARRGDREAPETSDPTSPGPPPAREMESTALAEEELNSAARKMANDSDQPSTRPDSEATRGS